MSLLIQNFHFKDILSTIFRTPSRLVPGTYKIRDIHFLKHFLNHNFFQIEKIGSKNERKKRQFSYDRFQILAGQELEEGYGDASSHPLGLRH